MSVKLLAIFKKYILTHQSVAWISSDYFESLLLPQLRGENDSKQLDEFQANQSAPTWIGDLNEFNFGWKQVT